MTNLKTSAELWNEYEAAKLELFDVEISISFSPKVWRAKKKAADVKVENARRAYYLSVGIAMPGVKGKVGKVGR